jgi:uncharacterized protein YggE
VKSSHRPTWPPSSVEPRYDPEHVTRLLGFEVTRSITVTLRDLAKLDALLDGAVQAGANRNFDVSVSTSQEERLRKEALQKALDDARVQASFAAERLGVRLGVVRSINLTSGGGTINTSVASAQTFGSPSAKFLPGVIRISASVSVDFTLQDP